MKALHRIRLAVLLGITVASGGTAAESVRPGFAVIDSIEKFRAALQTSNQKIRMKPGTYLVKDALPDNQTVFLASGSDNVFDLRGVTIQIDTKIFARFAAKSEHEITAYRVTGNGLTFEGGTFEDVGDDPPARGLPEFSVIGNGNTFRDCAFIIRGSAPYGYGRLFGKGHGRAGFPKTYSGKLQKHSAMQITGDNTKVIGARFSIQTFGHAIHIHGAQNTWVENTFIEGNLRPTDEILRETSGEAFDQKFVDMFRQPIPAGEMLALAEDGIRAYSNGAKDGKVRRTGAVTVINCTVKRMRGAISLGLAGKPARVENCTVIEAGWTGRGFNVPSGSVVKGCQGDAAYSPVFSQNSSTRDAQIELTVIGTGAEREGHPLAILNGSGHHVTLLATGKPFPPSQQILVAGPAEYSGEASGADGSSTARGNKVTLINRTRQAVTLTPRSSNCTITSNGPVTNQGTDNHVASAARGFPTVDKNANPNRRDPQQERGDR